MKDWEKYTSGFIFIMIFLIGAYDVFVIMQAGSSASISHKLLNWSMEFPMVPFIAGVLVGHLFWPMKIKESGEIKEGVKK